MLNVQPRSANNPAPFSSDPFWSSIEYPATAKLWRPGAAEARRAENATSPSAVIAQFAMKAERLIGVPSG